MRHNKALADYPRVDRMGLEPGMLVQSSNFLIFWRGAYWWYQPRDFSRCVKAHENMLVLSVDHDVDDIYSMVPPLELKEWNIKAATRAMVEHNGEVGWVIVPDREDPTFWVLAR